MTYGTVGPHDWVGFEREPAYRSVSPLVLIAGFGFVISLLSGIWLFNHFTAAPDIVKAPAAFPTETPKPFAAIYGGLINPYPYGALYYPARVASLTPAEEPVQSLLRGTSDAALPPQGGPIRQEVSTASLDPALTDKQAFQNIPLPMPRPAGLPAQAGDGPQRTRGREVTSVAGTVAAPAPAGEGSIFEKLFGKFQGSEPALAYANPEDGVARATPSSLPAPVSSAPPPGHYDRQTAVYDISARVVYMPNGTRLEAHSGLGELLDDPRYVSERMRGATPPHVYELALREQLFHGVQALRLNPIGSGGLYGRTGLLVHRFMLGPNGDSNGCVSIKDYDAFLQAYLHGEVKKLVVVSRL